MSNLVPGEEAYSSNDSKSTRLQKEWSNGVQVMRHGPSMSGITHKQLHAVAKAHMYLHQRFKNAAQQLGLYTALYYDYVVAMIVIRLIIFWTLRYYEGTDLSEYGVLDIQVGADIILMLVTLSIPQTLQHLLGTVVKADEYYVVSAALIVVRLIYLVIIFFLYVAAFFSCYFATADTKFSMFWSDLVLKGNDKECPWTITWFIMAPGGVLVFFDFVISVMFGVLHIYRFSPGGAMKLADFLHRKTEDKMSQKDARELQTQVQAITGKRLEMTGDDSDDGTGLFS